MVTLVAQRPRAGARALPTSSSATLALIALLITGAATAVVARPTESALAMVGLAAVGAIMLRIEWAVLAYVAAEPFGDYLTTVSSASVKLVGGILFVAWLLRMVVDARPLSLRHPTVYAAAGLLLALLLSTVAHVNGAAGVQVVSRYLSYLMVLVVLVDTMRTGLAPRRVAATFVLANAAAAVAGLVDFLRSHGGRAAGPMQDANDFAFYLVCALPFAVMLWRQAPRFRWLYGSAAVVLVLTTLATFSRGALLGIVAMLAVATLFGILRVRLLVAGALAVAVAVGAVVVLAPALVERSLHEKEHVAADNVESRFTSWRMAAEMTADSPLVGQGPGGFRTHFDQYVGTTADTTHLDVAHQMYLDVASELGLLGATAFVAMLALGVAGAARARRSPGTAPMAAAVCIAFAGTLVAASFLSEQYYLPVWLLVAFGAALDPRGEGTS